MAIVLVKVRLHDTTGDNRFDNRLYRVYKHSTGCQTGLTTDCSIVQPVGQPAASCKQTSNPQVVWQQVVSCERGLIDTQADAPAL